MDAIEKVRGFHRGCDVIITGFVCMQLAVEEQEQVVHVTAKVTAAAMATELAWCMQQQVVHAIGMVRANSQGVLCDYHRVTQHTTGSGEAHDQAVHDQDWCGQQLLGVLQAAINVQPGPTVHSWQWGVQVQVVAAVDVMTAAVMRVL